MVVGGSGCTCKETPTLNLVRALGGFCITLDPLPEGLVPHYSGENEMLG